MWFIPTIREKMREKGISLNDDHIFVFCKERGIEPKLKYGSDGKCLGYAITLVVWLVADCGRLSYQITENYKRVVTLQISTNTAINYTTC